MPFSSHAGKPFVHRPGGFSFPFDQGSRPCDQCCAPYTRAGAARIHMRQLRLVLHVGCPKSRMIRRTCERRPPRGFLGPLQALAGLIVFQTSGGALVTNRWKAGQSADCSAYWRWRAYRGSRRQRQALLEIRDSVISAAGHGEDSPYEFLLEANQSKGAELSMSFSRASKLDVACRLELKLDRLTQFIQLFNNALKRNIKAPIN